MKKYLGQIIFNIAVITAGVSFISLAPKFLSSSPVVSIAGIIIMMAFLGFGNYSFIKRSESGRRAFDKPYTITENTFENLNEASDYIDVMKELEKCPLCRNEAVRVVGQWESYKKKAETLDAICTDGGIYDIVNQDTESVLLRNMMLFMKRAAIMQSAARNENMEIHRRYLAGIIQSNEKILNNYTDLLVEASQITGDSRDLSEIESLEVLVQSIKDCRNEFEKGELQ